MRHQFLDIISERYIKGLRNADLKNGDVMWGGDIRRII